MITAPLLYIAHLTGWFLAASGLIIILIGVIGLWRLPGFFSQIHAGGLIDSLGLPMTFLGLALLQPNLLAGCKLIFMLFLVLLLNPTATHALAKLAYNNKNKMISDRTDSYSS